MKIKAKKDTKYDLKEPLKLIIIGLIIIFIISLPLRNLVATLKLTITYMFFIYLPLLPIISRIKNVSIVEKVLLVNVAGLSYSAIYVILDAILKIPLTKRVFLIVTLVFAGFSWRFYLKGAFLKI
jgi:hypothetical protein